MGGGSLADSREAMVNAVVDAFGAFNMALGHQGRTSSLLSPNASMRLFPLYVLGMLKHVNLFHKCFWHEAYEIVRLTSLLLAAVGAHVLVFAIFFLFSVGALDSTEV